MVFKKLCVFLAIMLFSFASAEQRVEQESRSLLFWCSSYYKCPANSYFLPFRWCYYSFKDCACNHGYYKSPHEDKCLPSVTVKPPVVIQPPAPKCFTCPSKSYGKFYSTCYKSFNDCECVKGFYKSLHENKCIKQKYLK